MRPDEPVSRHPIASLSALAPAPAPLQTPPSVGHVNTHWKRVFETLAAQATSPKSPILFVSIDAEELPDISESYDVSAVPFFVLLKAHQIVRKLSGADPAELAKAIETHSGAPGFALPPPQKTAAPTTAGDAATADASEPAAEEDINTRLGKLVAAAPVMLFMKGTPSAPQCGFSRQLVGLLRDKGVRYGFFNILADDEVRQGLKTYSDWPTFPQLYVSGQLVGGLDIVSSFFPQPRG